MSHLLIRMLVILLSCLFSFTAFSYEPIEKYDREKEFTKALELLKSFKNDSANVILVRLIKDLSLTGELDTPFGLHVQLRNAEALEKDHQDAIAIEKLLSVVKASKEKEEWEVLANSYLSLARLYEKLSFDEKCLAYLSAAEFIIKENNLSILNARFYSRLSSYYRLFGSKDSAVIYANAVLVHAVEHEQFEEEAVGHLLLGMLKHKSSFNEAVYHYSMAGNFWKESGDFSGYSAVLGNLSDLYLYQGDFEIALIYNDSSLLAASNASSMGVEKKHLFYSNYKERAEIFEELRLPDSALFYLRKAYDLEMYDVNNSSKKDIFEISSRYQAEQQNEKIKNQNALLDFERSRKRILIFLICIVLFFTFLLTVSFLRLQKATQKAKKQAKELKVLDQVKTKFFGNISHELKTPLSLIIGPLSAILDQKETWEKEEGFRQLKVVLDNSKKLMNLINEILDLSKLEANKMELRKDSVEVGQFFYQILSSFESQFQNLNIQYELNLRMKDSLFVSMDEKKVEKVVNNFLSNAIKFTPEKGKIILEVSQVANAIRIKVSDTGRGIHPDDLPHIFNRFFQSGQANQRQDGGTGIGLALVREFADLMEGKAYVKSELGQGSEFFFEFPLVILDTKDIVENSYPIDEIESANKVLVSPIVVGDDKTILIVEDNADLRYFIYQLLQKKYKRILLAENGAEGVELLNKYGEEIHLILSDVMMPRMDGWSFLNKLRSHPQWKNIPIIMLTALATEKYKLNALTIGVDDYITKPFSVPELQVRIQNLLYNYEQRLEWRSKLTSEDDQPNVDLPEENKMRDVDKEWVDELKRIIKDSFAEKVIEVPELAAAVFLSSRQLNRKLKSIVGLSPAKFIKEIQLQSARAELERGDGLSIFEVSCNNGFEYQATFSTSFKNRFGISPREYQKTHLNTLVK